MRIRLQILLIFLPVLVAETTDRSKPAPSNSYGKEYPRIHSDRRVTFKIKFPDAKSVAVAGRAADSGMNGNKRWPMTRSDDGTWSVTTDPIRALFKYYELFVDGHHTTDPSS
jgi:hypothetical protein